MGPLQGIRIVEMDAIGPVPLAGMILADMGADIVRIARAGGHSAYDDVGSAVLARSRRVLELDLKSDEGLGAARRLIARSDALIEGFRPGVMERLGLGPDACLQDNPKLVFGRITGWGQTGPLSLRAGHDINYIAIAGALSTIGRRDAPPLPPLNLVGDYGGGAMFLALGVLAGILHAQRTGAGQVVDAAMTDGVATMMSLFMALGQNGGWTEQREMNLLDGGAPFYRCYRCRDGGHIAVGALEPQFFAVLTEKLGIAPDRFRQYDKADWPGMQAAFAEIFATRTRNEWDAIFSDTDACVAPVLTMTEAAEHPHNRARETFETHDGVRHPAPAPRFSATPSKITPQASVDAADILNEWSS